MRDEQIEALIATWRERRNEICRTLDRCDSAKAFEVQRCADELAALLAVPVPQEQKVVDLVAVLTEVTAKVWGNVPEAPAVSVPHQEEQSQDLAYAARLVEDRIPLEGPAYRSLLTDRAQRIRELAAKLCGRIERGEVSLGRVAEVTGLTHAELMELHAPLSEEERKPHVAATTGVVRLAEQRHAQEEVARTPSFHNLRQGEDD